MKNRQLDSDRRPEDRRRQDERRLMGFGGVAAGMTFYLKDGVPVFDYNYFEDHAVIKGDKPVPDGEATVELGFNYAGDGQGKGAKVTIKVDGEIKKVVIDVKS